MEWDMLPGGAFYHLTFIPGYKKMPAPGVGIFDAPTACIEINSEWVSFVIGRLELLSDKRIWSGNSSEQLRASEEIEKLLQALSLPCDNDCPECPPPPECPPQNPPQLRQNGNCIEWLNPETSVWECQLTIELPTVLAMGDCDCDCCEDCEDDDCEDCEGW